MDVKQKDKKSDFTSFYIKGKAFDWCLYEEYRQKRLLLWKLFIDQCHGTWFSFPQSKEIYLNKFPNQILKYQDSKSSV